MRSRLTFFLAFLALLLALHLPYLRLPFHWDELGQFVPAALDLYQDGSWIPHTTDPNVHPPGLAAVLAAVWSLTGYSIRVTRLTMVVIASLGALLSFLLAIRLAGGANGAPAFAAVLFLIASPLFYMQSMMVLLDLPAMTLTMLVLLLFLDGRYAWCAAAAVALVLLKETAVTTPLVLGAWLWLKERRPRQAAYFIVPAAALGVWLVILRQSTGRWLGNAEFAQLNVATSVQPLHIVVAIASNFWALFIADGRFIGSIALVAGWKLLRGREWTIVFLIAAAQFAIVTVFGGAILQRYLLPIMPLVFAAMAVGASVYRTSWRWVSQGAMTALLVAGWFWSPPYPSQLENNLAMVNFVRLQQDAAGYLQAWERGRIVATAWPFVEALRRPEFGYVEAPLRTVPLHGLDLASIADTPRDQYDLLVVFSTRTMDLAPVSLPWLQKVVRQFSFELDPATEDRIRAGLGMVPRMQWERGGLTLTIYGPP